MANGFRALFFNILSTTVINCWLREKNNHELLLICYIYLFDFLWKRMGRRGGGGSILSNIECQKNMPFFVIVLKWDYRLLSSPSLLLHYFTLILYTTHYLFIYVKENKKWKLKENIFLKVNKCFREK